jgi:hypothetical protein
MSILMSPHDMDKKTLICGDNLIVSDGVDK